MTSFGQHRFRNNRNQGKRDNYDDVIKWKHFPRYCPFVRGIQRSTVDYPHKGQWRGALMFSFICAWKHGLTNHRDAGYSRRHHTGYDVTVMPCKQNGALLMNNCRHSDNLLWRQIYHRGLARVRLVMLRLSSHLNNPPSFQVSRSNGESLGFDWLAETLMDVTHRFAQSHPDFVGVKIIVTFHRWVMCPMKYACGFVVFSWWRHQMEIFPRYWLFVRGIHRTPVNSPHKGQ